MANHDRFLQKRLEAEAREARLDALIQELTVEVRETRQELSRVKKNGNGNGNGRTTKILLSILVAMLISAILGGATKLLSMDNRLVRVETILENRFGR